MNVNKSGQSPPGSLAWKLGWRDSWRIGHMWSELKSKEETLSSSQVIINKLYGKYDWEL